MMKMPSSLQQVLGLIFLIVSLLLTSSDAFATTKTKAAASKPVAADQAVAIFGKTFPYGRPPVPPSARVRFGMPTTDFDGSTVMQEKYKNPGKRLVDITEKEARAAFVELAKCYGDQEALQMVKATPICLSFNKNNFKPSLEAFADIFGKQEAQQMVQRNPGLLALNPESAATATDQTMVFSYLVGYTRPVGPILLGLLAFALASLPFQAATGIVVREEILKIFQ